MAYILYDASLTGLFKLIIILMVVYGVYVFITRYILPVLVQNYIRNFQQRFFEENPHLQEKMKQKKEGEITIERVESGAPPIKANDEEYIDFEEIK